MAGVVRRDDLWQLNVDYNTQDYSLQQNRIFQIGPM